MVWCMHRKQKRFREICLVYLWKTVYFRQISSLHFALPMTWGAVVGLPTALIGMLVTHSAERWVSFSLVWTLLNTSHCSSPPLFSDWMVSTWLLGTGQGLVSFFGVVLILLALKFISPTQNKVIRSFQVVGSYIVQVSSSHNASKRLSNPR